MDLGNALDGDSSNLSDPVGEQSLEVSWTESSQNSPASQRHEVAMGGEQSNGGASSSGCERWSCADPISRIFLREADKIASLYGVEVGFPQ